MPRRPAAREYRARWWTAWWLRPPSTIEATAHDTPTSGLAGFRVDGEHNTLHVYWHGEMPAAPSSEIVAARAKGITVDVSPAPYTHRQLVNETARLAKLATPSNRTQARVDRIWPKFDGSGIGVGVSGLSSSLTPAQVDVQARQLLPASTLPVRVEASHRVLPVDRYEDSAPFWGGAYTVAGFACTTGFGVSGNAGGSFMLFADHCGHGEWRTGEGDLVVGSTVAIDSNNDAQLLQSNSGAYVYIGDSLLGGVQGGSPVRGYQRTRVGDEVCTSGAFSGTVCQVQVYATEQAIFADGYGWVFGVAAGHEEHGNAAAGNGDSGGPVVVLNGDLSSIARGTITSILDDFVPCPGVPTGDHRQCSADVQFPDIGFALDAFNAHVNVAS